MTLYDIVFTFVFVLVVALALISIAYGFYSTLTVIFETINIRVLKRIVLDILLKEDDKNALNIISDEYSKAHMDVPKFRSLIGKIATELRSGVYLKYYKKPIEDPMNLAKRLDTVLKLYDDKIVIDQFEQSEFVKELGGELNAQMTKQDILMGYSKIHAYFLGRIHEKNTEINNLKKKLTKTSIGKGLAILGWIVGLVSGILTIVTYFSK